MPVGARVVGTAVVGRIVGDCDFDGANVFPGAIDGRAVGRTEGILDGAAPVLGAGVGDPGGLAGCSVGTPTGRKIGGRAAGAAVPGA